MRFTASVPPVTGGLVGKTRDAVGGAERQSRLEAGQRGALPRKE